MTNELIAEARQEVSIHDKLGDGFSEGSEERAFYYGHRDRYKRLADALEAAEARVKELEAQVKELKCEQVFRISEMQELVEAQHRISELESKLAARQLSENDREVLIDVVKRNRSVVKRMSDGYPSVAFATDETIADAILAAGFSRAAVPDAATWELERAYDLIDLREFEIDDLHEIIIELRAERDAALAAIERVRAEARAYAAQPDVLEPCGAAAQSILVALDGAPEPDSDDPCDAEVYSWDHYRPEQIDSYWIRCTLLGKHDEHEDSHTGLKWRSVLPVEGESDGV